MRAAKDPIHQRIVEQIRNLNITNPIDDEIIDILFDQCQLTKSDLENDAKLRKAIICVSGNIEKLAYENLMLKDYAIKNGYPIIKWKNEITSNIPDACKDILFSSFHENNCKIGFLYQSFVPGASCICLDNLNLMRGMCNGTPVTQHSLVMETELEMDSLNELIKNSKPGEVILLKKRPKYVNMTISNDIVSYWNDNKISILDRSNNQRYIPFDSDKSNKVKLTGIAGITNDIYYKMFPFEFNLVCSEYKVQGQTLDKIISVLRSNPSISFKTSTINCFLVKLSRVRMLEDFKILPVASREELLFLKTLQYSTDLKRFLDAYDSEGNWIDPISEEEKRKTNDHIANKLYFQKIKVNNDNLNTIVVNNKSNNNNKNEIKKPRQQQKVKIDKVKDSSLNTVSIISKNSLFSSKKNIISKKRTLDTDSSIQIIKPISHSISFSDNNYFNHGLENSRSIWCYFNSAIHLIIHDDDIRNCIKNIQINSNITTDLTIKAKLEFVIALGSLVKILDNNMSNKKRDTPSIEKDKNGAINLVRSSFKKVYPNLNLDTYNDVVEFYTLIFQIFHTLSYGTTFLGYDFFTSVMCKYSFNSCRFQALQCNNCHLCDKNFAKDFEVQDENHSFFFFDESMKLDIPIQRNDIDKLPLAIALKAKQDINYEVINNLEINFNCPYCNVMSNSIIQKRNRVIKYPNTLVIMVQSFQYQNNQLGLGAKKFNNFIEFPLEMKYSELELFDMSVDHIENYKQDFVNNINSTYSLVSFIEHYGSSIHGGHYKSFIRDKTYNIWYCMNDSIVTKMSKNQIESILRKNKQNGIYLAIYEKNISCIRNKINLINNNDSSSINTNVGSIHIFSDNAGKPDIIKRSEGNSYNLRDKRTTTIKILSNLKPTTNNPYKQKDDRNNLIILDHEDDDEITNINDKIDLTLYQDNNINVSVNNEQPINTTNIINTPSYFNFLTLNSESIINIPTILLQSIKQSKQIENDYNGYLIDDIQYDGNGLNWSDLFRVQSNGYNGWLCSSIINLINILQMNKFKIINNIYNNESLPFFIFSTYCIPDDDNFFIVAINSLNTRIVREYKFDIFSGIKSHLFFPINHSNSHWTLLMVSLLEKKIYFMDSYYSRNKDLSLRRGNQMFPKIKKFLNVYANNIYSLSESASLNIDNYEEIHIKTGVPQQTNDYDCGVFQLTIIDSLLNNNYEFSQENMPNIRKNLLAFAIKGKMY